MSPKLRLAKLKRKRKKPMERNQMIQMTLIAMVR